MERRKGYDMENNYQISTDISYIDSWDMYNENENNTVQITYDMFDELISEYDFKGYFIHEGHFIVDYKDNMSGEYIVCHCEENAEFAVEEFDSDSKDLAIACLECNATEVEKLLFGDTARDSFEDKITDAESRVNDQKTEKSSKDKEMER